MTKKLGLFSALLLGGTIFTTGVVPAFATNNSEAQQKETVKLDESDVVETAKTNSEVEGEFIVEVDDQTAETKITISEKPQTTTGNNEAQQEETVKLKESDVSETPKTNSNIEGNDIIVIDDQTVETKITTTE